MEILLVLDNVGNFGVFLGYFVHVIISLTLDNCLKLIVSVLGSKCSFLWAPIQLWVIKPLQCHSGPLHSVSCSHRSLPYILICVVQGERRYREKIGTLPYYREVEVRGLPISASWGRAPLYYCRTRVQIRIQSSGVSLQQFRGGSTNLPHTVCRAGIHT